MFKEIIARTVYGFSRMRPYERICLESARELLPIQAQEILDNNIEFRGWVQRSADDKQVLFRWIDDNDEMRLIRFPNRNETVYFARIELESNELKPIRADLSLFDGMIFGIEFDRPPKNITHPLSVIRCRLVGNVMNGHRKASVSRDAREFLSNLFPGVEFESIEPPADESMISDFQDRVDSGIPNDLKQLLRFTNGFKSGRWRFLGTNARRLLLKDYNVWCVLISEYSPMCLCLIEGGDTHDFFLFNQEDEELGSTGSTLGSSFLRLLR